MNITSQLASRLAYVENLFELRGIDIHKDGLHWPRAQYTNFSKTKILEVGDLVVCRTSVGWQTNPWIVSFIHEVGIPNDPYGMCLRAIGSNALCNYGNEDFIKLSGFSSRDLYEGEQWIFYRKVLKAVHKEDNYNHIFAGLDFDASEPLHRAQLSIRERWGGLSKPSKPYIINLEFNKKTSVKQVLDDMKAQGFGTRDFELIKPAKEPNGDISTTVQKANGDNEGLVDSQ
jgi:hypothetical protein